MMAPTNKDNVAWYVDKLKGESKWCVWNGDYPNGIGELFDSRQEAIEWALTLQGDGYVE